MNHFDKEIKIIEAFQVCADPKLARFMTDNANVKCIYNSIVDEDNWKNWADSSAKNAPPPDYYNDELKLMMEVMRIDDHAREGKKKGHIINPTNERESKLRKQFFGNVDLDKYYCELYINVNTGLPAKEDHNYNFYKDNFARVINEHKKKIAMYKRNHPNYKTIFFIMDESFMYYKVSEKDAKRIFVDGDKCEVNFHYWCVDKVFLESFKNSEIDYLIWHTPNKLFKNEKGFSNLPNVHIYDIREMNFRFIDYDPNLIISCEV